jgi:uncharacterized protein YdhG (YjbR/CyaY superfamily)
MADPNTVEEYLAGLPEEQRAALERLRETIKAAAPEATETISYKMPAYKTHGRFLVSFAAYKNHFSMYPASDEVKRALGERLTPFLASKATIRFAWDARLPISLVKQVVKVRLRENAADPGR